MNRGKRYEDAAQLHFFLPVSADEKLTAITSNALHVRFADK